MAKLVWGTSPEHDVTYIMASYMFLDAFSPNKTQTKYKTTYTFINQPVIGDQTGGTLLELLACPQNLFILATQL